VKNCEVHHSTIIIHQDFHSYFLELSPKLQNNDYLINSY